MGVIESLLQSKRRSKTCVVIRETEFVKIPNDLLRNIVINYSSAAQVLLNFLVQRMLSSKAIVSIEFYDLRVDYLLSYSLAVVSYLTVKGRKFGTQMLDINEEWGTHGETRRIHSIALIPVSEALPYSVLAVEIKRHFSTSGENVFNVIKYSVNKAGIYLI